MVTINKENAAHYLRAQMYLMKFTTDDPMITIMFEAIEIVLEENKELKKQISQPMPNNHETNKESSEA